VRSRVTPATAGDFAFRWVYALRSRGLPDDLEADAAVGPRQIAGLRVAAFRAGWRDDGVTLADAGGMALRCACALRLQGRPDEIKAGVVVGPRQIAGLRVATFCATRRNGGGAAPVGSAAHVLMEVGALGGHTIGAMVTILQYTCS